MVLVEPGGRLAPPRAGARTASDVVHAPLKEARFRDGALPAIGFFDVMEHIDDEQGFLCEIRRCLAADGRIYLTVPAGRWLWSDDDVQAGHYRRATRVPAAVPATKRAGFRLLFVSKMFSPLPLPLFLCRSLPSLFGRRRLSVQSYSGLHQAPGRTLMDHVSELGTVPAGPRAEHFLRNFFVLPVAPQLSSYKSKKFSNVNQR